jgi:hypothetical protein
MTLILSGTNGLSDVDGDASTPAVRGTDANTPLTTRTALIVTVALNANYAVRDCTDVSVSIFR